MNKMKNIYRIWIFHQEQGIVSGPMGDVGSDVPLLP